MSFWSNFHNCSSKTFPFFNNHVAPVQHKYTNRLDATPSARWNKGDEQVTHLIPAA